MALKAGIIMLQKADLHILENKFSYENDPFRLHYHPMPPIGWMNDPNGLVCFNGIAHLFFQFYPYEACNGSKHWGHLTSSNLVDWCYNKTVIAPDMPYDASGCYSGTAIAHKDKLYLLYTGHVEGKSAGQLPVEVQCLAESSDGINFSKYERNPVIYPRAEFDWNFRDPKVWRHEDRFYCILGNCEGGHGRVLLYSSPDLISWKYVGVMLESDGSQGFMWECPDFFSLDGQDILLLSPEGMENKRHSTIYMVGSLDYATGRFTPKATHTLDDGNEFYAPQTFEYKGMRVLVGWMDKWFSQMPTQEYGWAGAMTFPRVLNLTAEGLLTMEPIASIEDIRKEGIFHRGVVLKDGFNPLSNVKAVAMEFKCSIDLDASKGEQLVIGIRENGDKSQGTYIKVLLKEQLVVVDKTKSGLGDSYVQTTPIKPCHGNSLDIRVLVDTSSVEVLINKGTTAVTNRIYPDVGSNCFSLSAVGGEILLSEMECFTLGRNKVTYEI